MTLSAHQLPIVVDCWSFVNETEWVARPHSSCSASSGSSYSSCLFAANSIGFIAILRRPFKDFSLALYVIVGQSRLTFNIALIIY